MILFFCTDSTDLTESKDFFYEHGVSRIFTESIVIRSIR